MGKGSEAADQMALSLAQADNEMLKFSVELANSLVKGLKSAETAFREAGNALEFEKRKSLSIKYRSRALFYSGRFKK